MNEPRHLLTRRQFLGGSLSMAAAAPLSGIASSSGSTLELQTVAVPVENLPEVFRGFRIGFMTDIHLSAFLQERLLEEAIAWLSRLELDLLLLGGDYLWKPREFIREAFPIHRNSLADLDRPDLDQRIYTQLIEMLGDIKPREGIYAILGNHDRWAASQICERVFQHTPIRLLVNQSAWISRSGASLEIFGSDDYLTGRPRLPETANSPAPRILLTHNPDMLPWYLDHNSQHFSLALMGHTHGGQICPVRGLALSYNIQHARYGEGLVLHPSGCVCYTSRGLGCVGVPFRLNCPPEITLLTLENKT